MSKREKIILAGVVVALLYAGYTLFSSPSHKTGPVATDAELAGMKTLSAQISDEVNKGSLTETERYVLQRAEAEWPTDPFLGKKLSAVPDRAKTPEEGQLTEFIYSGYLEVNQKRLAVINGMEYMVGEQLESGGYLVKSIDPAQVVLKDMSKGGEITLPFIAQIF